MLEYEYREERSDNSETRLKNLDDWFDLQSDGLDMADIQRVLIDPEGGGCTCAGGDEDDPVVTLWS